MTSRHVAIFWVATRARSTSRRGAALVSLYRRCNCAVLFEIEKDSSRSLSWVEPKDSEWQQTTWSVISDLSSILRVHPVRDLGAKLNHTRWV